MAVLLALLATIAETYLESLKKDLAQKGIESILLIASISWIGCPVLIGALLLLGQYQLPTDPLFYLLWLALTLQTCVQFTLFLFGLGRSEFLAAEALSSLGFVATTFFAIALLHEQLTLPQVVAIIIAVLGALAFFRWKSISMLHGSENLGLLAILSSVLLAPLGAILYKSATFHTSSYQQFLSGRLTMDIVCYSAFLILLFMFRYRRNPLVRVVSLVSTSKGLTYMIGWVVVNLLYSWLIFKLPITLLTVLGTVSIPAGYLIGRLKYKEPLKPSYIVGAACILTAVVLFTIRDLTGMLR